MAAPETTFEQKARLLLRVPQLVPVIEILGSVDAAGNFVIPADLWKIAQSISESMEGGRVFTNYASQNAWTRINDKTKVSTLSEPTYHHSVWGSATELYNSLHRYALDGNPARRYFAYDRSYLGTGPFGPRHPSRFVPGSVREITWDEILAARQQERMMTTTTTITSLDGKPIVETKVTVGEPGGHLDKPTHNRHRPTQS